MGATMRLMMTRAMLHCMGTAVALYVSFMFAPAAMALRMTAYAFVWLGCAALYLALLYCGQRVLDALDERIRRVVRDEVMASEMRLYQRGLRYLVRSRLERYRQTTGTLRRGIELAAQKIPRRDERESD